MQIVYKFSELSRDDLYIRYAAMHIVKLPITVSAAWSATNTYIQLMREQLIHFFCKTSTSQFTPMQQENFHDNVAALSDTRYYETYKMDHVGQFSKKNTFLYFRKY